MLDNRTGKKRLIQRDIVIFTMILLYIDMLVQNILYYLKLSGM